MRFRERKNNLWQRYIQKKPAYTYTLLDEDIIGDIDFDSPKRLTPDQADAVLMTILKLKGEKGNIGDITYRFKKAKEWE